MILERIKTGLYDCQEVCANNKLLITNTLLSLFIPMQETQWISSLAGRCVQLGQLLNELSVEQKWFYAGKVTSLMFSILGCLYGDPGCTFSSLALNLFLQSYMLYHNMQQNNGDALSTSLQCSALTSTLCSLGAMLLNNRELLICAYASTTISMLMWLTQTIQKYQRGELQDVETYIILACQTIQTFILARLTLDLWNHPNLHITSFFTRQPVTPAESLHSKTHQVLAADPDIPLHYEPFHYEALRSV